jgi:CHAT domain-containing protein
LRRRSEADGDLERAGGKLRTDPAAAVKLLNQAIDTYRKRGNLQKLPQAYELRAQGLLAQHQVESAKKDLEEASRLLEVTLFSIDPGPLRQDRISVLQNTFDQMVEFQAMVLHDAAAAFRFSEQEKHWGLWEWARTAAPGTRGSPVASDPLAIADWTDLRALRNGDTAILVYHVLPERVLLWATGPRGSTMATVAIDREVLRAKLSTLLTLAERRNAAALAPSAEALYQILIAPASATIAGASTLVIVPDRQLQSLPFGLLRDRSTGRYLYESHPLVFSPSVTAYARLSRLRHDRERNLQNLLSIATTRGAHPSLRDLPGATEEAQAVAAQWPGGRTVLTFRDATSLLRQLALVDAFHFAGHALSGPGSLRLVLRDDAAQPLLLSAEAILQSQGFQRLRLVSLSGCRTVDVATASQIGGSSAGFVRSFLAAGVSTVVASFLELEDRQVQAVFPAFHRRLAGGDDPAQAIQQSCLEQPLKRDQQVFLCGNLAVFGISPPYAGNSLPVSVSRQDGALRSSHPY